MYYFSILFLLFILELLYFKIADRFNIIDKPNHRSSHTAITLRGGGIIFPIAVLLAFLLGQVSVWVAAAVILVSVVSFVDDVYPLPTLPRFLSHCIATGLILYDLNLFTIYFWLIPIVILVIGWINAFNFMDGINGITVLYALVSIITFGYLYQGQESFSVLVPVGLSCVVFGFYNVRRKAKTFAGDVGSISMALFLAYFMLKIIFEKEQIGYLLFFSVYGIDAVVTILYRIRNKENIFEAHRSHLYQYLANELQWSHIAVASVYAALQFGINSLVLVLLNYGYSSVLLFAILLVILTFLYWVIRNKVLQSIAEQKKALP
jgi:UDP-N-acetylmuramyl pentapeptide phosphotransferase/UDP-N-acetylglucosamine-1-phosphate transferase